MLNLGPGNRRIPCPACGKGTIRMADNSARLQCSRLRWAHSGFAGGHCDFATFDYDSIPLEPGERLVIVDFTPVAQLPAREPADPAED